MVDGMRLGVGKVTEFRYGLKMAQCIRSNDFNCLGGIYDQGWGMVDGMHAVVFVDNHDNQRGHGGGGGVLTASNQIEGNPAFHNDWQYKVAVAFMLVTTTASRESCPPTTSRTPTRAHLVERLLPSQMLAGTVGLVSTGGAAS